jgi:hypothetical protein
MVLLGEIHGVRQTPAQIARLVQLLDIRTVAFEWHTELVPTIERFRTGGPLDDHPLLSLGDGRVTVGHLALLRHLHAVRPELRWTAFDDWSAPPREPGESHWTARDRRMATRVLDAIETTDRALVIAGNLHTSLTDVAAGTPMGARIARQRPDVQTISIRYGRGRFYNLGGRTRHVLRSPASARLHLQGASLTLDEPRPDEAYVPHRPADQLRGLLAGT